MRRFQDVPKPKRICDKCGRPLPSSWHKPTCEACLDHALYSEVKEYILANDVTEFEVADHFNIPLEKVRRWIHEGYIEYKPFNPFDV